jgi:hypothetical protein
MAFDRSDRAIAWSLRWTASRYCHAFTAVTALSISKNRTIARVTVMAKSGGDSSNTLVLQVLL